MNGNVVTIVGNVTRDPEVKFTQTGKAMLRFGIADNHGWKDKNGEWQKKVSFIDCVAWGQLAENIAETISKGMRIVVTGRMDMQQWVTDDDQKRSKLELEIEAVGPDLRFASASVNANERSDSGGRPSGSGRRAPEPEVAEDEEPF